MASNINPNNINGQFPIAGQDNDSQGFRDNFTNTRTNLTYARDEIVDLQQNAILKHPLSDGNPINNNLVGVVLYGAQAKNFTESVIDHGTAGGSITIDFNGGGAAGSSVNGGDFHKLILGTSLAMTLAWNNNSGPISSGVYAKMRVWIVVNNVANTVTLAALPGTGAYIGLDSIPGANSLTRTISAPLIGDYLFEFGTIDGGNNVQVSLICAPVGNSAATEFASLHSAVAVLQANLAAVTTGTIVSNITALNSNVTTLQSNVTTLQSNVSTLTSGLSNVVINVTTLQSNVSTLTSGLSNVVSNVTTLQSNVSTFSANITSPIVNDHLRFTDGKWINVPTDGDLITYTVTVVDDGSAIQEVFALNGTKLKSSTGTLISPAVKFAQGNRYRFDLSDASNASAPLRFSSTPDTIITPGLLAPATATAYTSGVTINGIAGTPGAYVEIFITSTTPGTLYLYGDQGAPAIDTSLIGAAYPVEVTHGCCFSGSESLVGNVSTVLSLLTSASYFTPGSALTIPVNSTFATATTGGTLAAGTYWYRVSALNAAGETLASTQTSITTTGATSTVTVNWASVTGATGYKIYGRTTNAELYMATVGAVLTWTDTGSVTPSGALPTVDSTASATLAAGSNGQIKTLSMVDPTLGTISVIVANAGWKATGTGTIILSARGSGCTLQYINSKWFCIGNNGATFG